MKYINRYLLLFMMFCICNNIFAQSHHFPSASISAPPSYKGPLFELSQDFPQQLPNKEVYPWTKIDYKKQPQEYLWAVYKYVLEGNVECNWEVQRNTIRKWYHAPWMHYRFVGKMDMGREPLHGLTRERDSRPFELSPSQSSIIQNWAIGSYNDLGGYTIGQVWKDPHHPDPLVAVFPDNTVAMKLIFTEADSNQVPYLKNAPTFDCYVYQFFNRHDVRTIKKLSLLQIDVAVKDPRAKEDAGWVMGSFFYHADVNSSNHWFNVIPAGLSWGNDPNITPQNVKTNPLKQTYTNPNLKHDFKFGWAGRMNGLIDNPASSCISCHGAAGTPMMGGAAPDENNSLAERLQWFKKTANKNSTYFPNKTTLDYSLQLAVGIQNLEDYNTNFEKRTALQKLIKRLEPFCFPEPIFVNLLLIFLFVVYFSKKPALLDYNNYNLISKPLLVFRIFIGLIIISHGIPKLLGGVSSWMSLGVSMANFGIYWRPLLWGYFSTVAENLFGICIVMGCFFRVATLFLSINMFVAATKLYLIDYNIDNALHPATFLIVFVFLFMIGPGYYSMDRKLYSH